MKKLTDELDFAPLREHPSTLVSFKNELEDILGFADSFARLRSELDLFEEKLVEARKSNEFIDSKTAIKLFVTACALFRICQKTPYEKYVPFALAAISYFVEDEDGKNDFEDIDGFDDDQAVFNLIIAQFSLEKLVEQEVATMKADKESKSA